MEKYLHIKKVFEENKDDKLAISMANYMRNKFIFYGIPSSKRKLLTNQFIKLDKQKKLIDWEYLNICYLDDHREFQYFVNDYLLAMHKYLKYEDIPKIYEFIKEKQWWDTIDIQDKIIGNIGLLDPRVDDIILKWSLDENIWLRRLAIDYQLGRNEKTNKDLLLKVITNNLGTDEFFINKAIGWALRDYAKTNPDWVKSFINKYSDKMSKLSIKEARE